MAIGICSVLGVVLAFSGLAVFLVSLISLLPVNIYNAIRSCLILKDAMAISDSSLQPVWFFSSTILLALVSLALFLIMTGRSQGKTEQSNTTYGSTANGSNAKNTNTKPSIMAKHRHRVINIYSISYVAIDVIWVVADRHFALQVNGVR
ncbi:hypothetical protein BD408DRAFT_421382 [Parasitella parasitica]|nr:hypothetical protein BD408DRAFT_421382 [Parasitella parasitica]